MKDGLLKRSTSILVIWFFYLNTKTFAGDFPQDFRGIAFQSSRTLLTLQVPFIIFFLGFVESRSTNQIRENDQLKQIKD